MRYKNIGLPGEIKKVEMIDFHFNAHRGGMVTFENPYEEGLAYKNKIPTRASGPLWVYSI